MKITIEQINDNEEEELIFRCHDVNADIMELIRKARESDKSIVAYRDREIHRLSLSDIYYFEVVDNKSFYYCKEGVYESQMKLYEFERLCEGTAFFRASKSMVLNSDKIDYISPSLSGRFEVTLLNLEKVIVSRQYVAVLKKKMGL